MSVSQRRNSTLASASLARSLVAPIVAALTAGLVVCGTALVAPACSEPSPAEPSGSTTATGGADGGGGLGDGTNAADTVGDTAPAADAAAGDANLNGDGLVGADSGGDGAALGDTSGNDAGADLYTAPPPDILVTIDGVEQNLLVFKFHPTIDFDTYKAKVDITNQGSGALVLNALDFKTESGQLALDFYDAPLGPDDFPYTLGPFQKLALVVVFQTKPALKQSVSASLTVHSNDPSQPKVELLFSTPCVGAKPTLVPTDVAFVNAAPFVARTACVDLGNIGCVAQTFASAQVVPADSQWTVFEAPDVGAELDQLGSSGNPFASPTTQKICVRFMPKDASESAPAVALVVTVDQDGPKQVTTQLVPLWKPVDKLRFDCGGPARIDFGGSPVGTTRKCLIFNDGPGDLLVTALSMVPAGSGDLQVAVDASFALALLQPGSGDSAAPPWSLAAGNALEVAVTWKATPGTGGIPPSRVSLAFVNSNGAQEVDIPVFAPPCQRPVPLFAPAPLAFHAPSGSQVVRNLTMFNAGCVPMKFTKACTTLFNVTQDTPCETGAASTEYFLEGPPPDTVPAGGRVDIPVRFQPGGGAGPHYGQLHLFYCTGIWQAGGCQEGVVEKLSVQLEGSSSASIQPPSLALPPVAGAKAGHGMQLAGAVTPGSHPIGDWGAWQWLVTAAPPGSASWLWNASSDGAERLFVADLPGSYTVSATVSAFVPGVLASISWSPPASVTFQVAP